MVVVNLSFLFKKAGNYVDNFCAIHNSFTIHILLSGMSSLISIIAIISKVAPLPTSHVTEKCTTNHLTKELNVNVKPCFY